MECCASGWFVCYFLLVPDSDLSEHAQGFYLGAANGITAAFFLSSLWLSKKL